MNWVPRKYFVGPNSSINHVNSRVNLERESTKHNKNRKKKIKKRKKQKKKVLHFGGWGWGTPLHMLHINIYIKLHVYIFIINLGQCAMILHCEKTKREREQSIRWPCLCYNNNMNTLTYPYIIYTPKLGRESMIIYEKVNFEKLNLFPFFNFLYFL